MSPKIPSSVEGVGRVFISGFRIHVSPNTGSLGFKGLFHIFMFLIFFFFLLLFYNTSSSTITSVSSLE